MNDIAFIYQYPIKGFPGEKLEVVKLRANEGLPDDRMYALSSGNAAVNKGGQWSPCQAFQRMTIRSDLSMFTLERKDELFQLISPSGKRITIKEGDNSIDMLSDVFGSNTAIHRAISGKGYWDHKDASISIINLSTIEEISKRLGQVINPLRFRANLYIRAQPWSEFNWVGKKLLIGTCKLNIIRPIDRCSATSVNLETGKNDLNMPAELFRHFGHLFCGVYATVTDGGEIKVSSNIEIGANIDDSELTGSVCQVTSPSIASWPRLVTVNRVVRETEEVCSVWFNDSFTNQGTFDDYEPGMYIRLHDLSKSNVWRCYTVSKKNEDEFRITVKRDDGVGSQAIHNLKPNQKILMSGPFGNATIRQSSRALFLLSAGIGITPSVSKLQGLIDANYDKPVNLIHVARSKRDLALWSEVIELSKQLPHVKPRLYLTKEKDCTSDFIAGRPNLQKISSEIEETESDLHICGPNQFTNEIVDMLTDKTRLFVDTFFTPVTGGNIGEIKKCNPIKVTLVRSNVTKFWNSEDGTLLEFAEANGAVVSSHCRAGICNTCACKIISGSTTSVIDSNLIDRTGTLLCTSVPNEAVVLDI
jgi:ferredoxin-NADP reductase/uncharacterized protein YcbX